MQLLAIPQNTKSVRTQAVADGLGQSQRGRSGHGGIDRVAAFEHHAQTGLRGQRVRGGNHIARKQRQTGAGVGSVEIETHVGSVQSDLAVVDDFFPLGRLAGQHGAELCRAAAQGFYPQLLQLVGHFRVLERLVGRRVDAVDQLRT